MIVRDLPIEATFKFVDRFPDERHGMSATRTYIYRKLAEEVEIKRMTPVQKIRTTHVRDDGTVVFDYNHGAAAVSYVDAMLPVSSDIAGSSDDG